MVWPEGKRFALTFVDDTDKATVENVGPIYALLKDLGFRTTKTVWPLSPTEKPLLGGDTLEDPEYRDWILKLQRDGFEIAYHGTTDHPSNRERIIEGLDLFKKTVGHDPMTYAAHVGQKEAIYWGNNRLDGLPRLVYSAMNRLSRRDSAFYGEIQGSPYYWGDVCRERITYTRNFTFGDINTLKHDPIMPYHDPRRPDVRYWFSSSNGSDLRNTLKLLREENQDRLMEEGGACIVYTHFTNSFMEDGKINEEFVRLMRRLAAMPGWYVPTSTLLDYLRSQPSWKQEASSAALRRMQRTWLKENIQPDRWKKLMKRIVFNLKGGEKRKHGG